jgi:glycogen synthase
MQMQPDNLDVGTEALLATLQEALTLFDHRAAWKRLIGRAIQADFTWMTSARARAKSSIKAMTKRRRSLALG